jgi:hypothetical protein
MLSQSQKGGSKSPPAEPKGFLRPISSEPVRRFGRGHAPGATPDAHTQCGSKAVKNSMDVAYIENPTCRSWERGGAVTAASKALRSPMNTTCSVPRVIAV